MEVNQERLDALARALQKAREEGHTFKEIADLTGVTYASIRNFRTSGRIGLRNTERLEEWLLQEGIITERGEYSKKLHPKGDASPALAALLRNLADIIDNPAITHQERAALARVQLQAAEQMISILDRFQPPEPVKPS